MKNIKDSLIKKGWSKKDINKTIKIIDIITNINIEKILYSLIVMNIAPIIPKKGTTNNNNGN